MSLNSDLREFVALLNSRGVDYVVVGAHSLAFHARPRYTGDLDILIRPSSKNAEKIVALLEEFGFSSESFAAADFTKPNQVIQLGRIPNRIDLLTGISGVSTEDAFASRVAAEIDGLPVSILSKELLIKNKRAVARPQDLVDVKLLEEES